MLTLKQSVGTIISPGDARRGSRRARIEDMVQQVAAVRNDIESIIGAFDDALGSAMKHLVEWTLRTPR